MDAGLWQFQPLAMGKFGKFFARLCAFAFAGYEVFTLFAVAPIIYGMWQEGGVFMKAWLCFSVVGGIALSIAVPSFAVRMLSRISKARKTDGRE